jgi:ubiquinone/menaquinone biosynthesis C-methylase UbiE
VRRVSPESHPVDAGLPGSIPDAFDAAAPHYDLMVALNPGYHRHLRDAARALADALPGSGVEAGGTVLDLGCGSGASTRALHAALSATGRPRTEIVAVDGSSGMLAVARSKRWPSNVRFSQVLAEQIAEDVTCCGLSSGVDGVFAAYLFRNVAARDDLLTAVRSLLRPGGVLVVQEYSVSGSRPAAFAWTLVCWLVVIPLGWATTRDTTLYRYLWRSVRRFDSVRRFADRLREAGFGDVEASTVLGWQRGILHTFRARTPS